jgi:predicted metal-binding protein
MEIPFRHQIKEIILDELKLYFRPDVFIEYCKACEYYNKIWACPPYDFDITKVFEGYQYAYIIGSRLDINDLGEDFKELLNSKDLEYVISEIHKASRIIIDKKLDEIWNKEKHLQVLFAGRCLVCDHCTREKQIPCIHPEKMHLSLESIGFDVSSICENILGYKILWAKESLPEYFIFVSAIFSQEKLDIQATLGLEN